MTPKVIWEVVRAAADRADIAKLAPHDLRRTCARLCHLAGGELDQIQFLLGHVSIQTTEPYLGCKQKLRYAVNDTLEHEITEQQGKAVEDFVAAGNGFYALHNSSNIALYSKHFRSVMGGAYIGHPPLRPFKVRVVNKEHPITRGVEDFMVNDEQHFVTYDKDPKDIILRSENVDGLTYEGLGTESFAGWAYEFGKGRVVFTAAGHTLHSMWNPEYLKIQKNALP